MKVIIAGGGTGGHLYPGIAIAREVLREQGNRVLFVGTVQGIEARVLPKEGLPLCFITVGKLKGMKLFSVIKTMISLPLSLLQSLRLLVAEKPDVVLGVGGYASGPIGLAALLLRIPLLLLEPNSYAGLANRTLGKFASKALLCFPGTNAQKFFPAEKTALLGPLVRKGIENGDRTRAFADFKLDPEKFTVFVMGGSGGAHAINMAMKAAAPSLSLLRNSQILHQTGEKDADEVRAGYREAGVLATVLPFVEDMAGAYATADLVIGRAGATTVAELAVCGKRAVLVPFPFAADNHQEYNARTLEARGSAEVLLQQDLNAEALAALIKKYAGQGQEASRLSGMANTAAEEIAGICKSYVQKN